jgi:hypothetical protein
VCHWNSGPSRSSAAIDVTSFITEAGCARTLDWCASQGGPPSTGATQA